MTLRCPFCVYAGGAATFLVLPDSAESDSMTEYRNFGLSSADVTSRIDAGLTNAVKEDTSRSVASIARANIFTLFNAILTTAMVVVLIVGMWKDAVFGFVMIANAIIGIASEWRAKRTLDALAIVDAARARVWRDGECVQVLNEDLVLGDAIELGLGDRIGVDAEVLDAAGLEIDESLLTGESVPVRKQPGDTVLAGTHVVAGAGLICATAVGESVYAQGITRQVKKFTRTVSEIQQGIDAILRWISFFILPVVAIMTWTQFRASESGGHGDWRFALVLAVAGIVGMIPQGLVLLTSMNFALGSAKLARRSVLVQELPAVEVLARVDCLNLDKTGTLTTGGIRLKYFTDITGASEAAMPQDALGAVVALNGGRTNPTAHAIMDGVEAHSHYQATPFTPTWEIAFNSARKWSACGDQHNAWYLGAPEILMDAMGHIDEALSGAVCAHAQRGRRVVLLVHSESTPEREEDGTPIPALPTGLRPVMLAILEEDLRPDAAETLAYFREQGVRVRVISGDNPATVAALAETVGLRAPDGGAPRMIDARDLPADMDSAEFIRAIRKHDVFGRVTPEQKRAMVRAQQSDGHTVAMTGDGVNDALALKDADLGIAMGNGAAATKAVAQIVLVKGEFSVLPGVVAEGRRIIANMERVSSLFLTKTMYSVVCILATSILVWPYPFLPRHLTYIGDLTIGIPAFFIALGPNTRRYIPGFLRRTLALALPSGFVVATTSLLAYWLVGINTPQASTVATLTLMMGALWLTAITGRPLVGWRAGLIGALAAVSVLGLVITPVRDFFALVWPTPTQWGIIGTCGAAGILLVEGAYRYIYVGNAAAQDHEKTPHA